MARSRSFSLLLAALCLLAGTSCCARAQSATDFDSSAGLMVLDMVDAPTADNSTAADSNGAAGGRKLLGYAPQYYIKFGGYKGGYVACGSGGHAGLGCWVTPYKQHAAHFVLYKYHDEWQFQLAGSCYCLTLLSNPHNWVQLYTCAKLEQAPWYQLWNVYKTYQGHYTFRTGPKLSDWALKWSGAYDKPLLAFPGLNPDTDIGSIATAAKF